MNAKTLRDVIKEYNSHEDEVFDRSTDLFISNVRKELERMYIKDEWGSMIGVSELAIYISSISQDFKTFKFKILPFASGRNGETVKDQFDYYQTISDYFKNKEYEGSELCLFQDIDILALKPFCKILEKKGFKCYVDAGDRELVVTLKIS